MANNGVNLTAGTAAALKKGSSLLLTHMFKNGS